MAVWRDCLYCSSRFMAKLDRRLFCSDACRARHNRETHLTCFYCGEVATSKEHIYPQSIKRHGNNETVRACHECNQLAGVLAPFDIEERVQYLIGKLSTRYRLNKRIAEWDDEEIMELGPKLKSMVQAKILARQRAANRVLYMEGVLRWLIHTSEVTEQPEPALMDANDDEGWTPPAPKKRRQR